MSVRHLNRDAQQTNRNIGVEMGERFGSHQLTDPSIGTDETARAKKSKTCSSSETPTFKGIVKKKKKSEKKPTRRLDIHSPRNKRKTPKSVASQKPRGRLRQGEMGLKEHCQINKVRL